jgi:hypothetical protein
MADFNVDVNLPSAINVDITSPTQALATNISIPGPQGPRGEKGNPTSINSLTAENIIITGADGNIVYNTGLNTIFISGNSGYFQSSINSLTTNLNNTGANLNTSINSLSGLFTGYTGTLDATYATDSQLNSTGNTLNIKIDNLSGYVNSQDTNLSNNLASTGSYLQSNINTLSSNLNSTGSNLENKITSLSGDAVLEYGNQTIQGQKTFTEDLIVQKSGFFWSGIKIGLNSIIINEESIKISGDPVVVQSTFTGYTGDVSNTYATINNLVSTGGALETKIGSLSGTLTSNYATINNLNSTGSTLEASIASTGNTLNLSINSLSGTLTSTYATITNLASTGSTLNNSISSLSGTLTSTYATINNLASTGSTLATNLASTGLNLDTKINTLSGSSVLLYGDQSIGGVKTFRDNVYINNLFVTGTETIVSTNNFNVQSPYLLLNLTGGAVDGGIFFVTGSSLTGINDTGAIIGFDHSNKFKFGVSTRNSDLSTLPDIASVQDITAYSGFVDGKYSTIINLGLTGSTLVTNLASTGSTLATNLTNTGSTLQTNINNLSGYINSSSSNIVFTTGNQTISGTKTFANNLEVQGTGIFNALDLSNISDFSFSGVTINLINSTVQSSGQIYISGNPVLTGVNLSSYATITNLASTGSTLSTNLASTGSTLQTNINDLSNTYATITNLASTGSTLVTNLASTGSTLNTKINNLSGYVNSTGSNIVFTTGNQTISGDKIFKNNIVIEQTGIFSAIDLSDTDSILLSGIDIQIVSGSMTLTNPPTISGNPFITGNLALYATTINLASTGNTLNTSINSLSGTLTSNYATITNLASTGSTLNSNINSLSGTLTITYATISNLASTGSTLATNLANTGSTLQTNINNLSGYINSSSSNIVFTTGNQTISGVKSFAQDTTFGDSAQGDFLVISGNNFTVYGSGNFTSGLFVNSNAVLTGVDLSNYATKSLAIAYAIAL